MSNDEIREKAWRERERKERERLEEIKKRDMELYKDQMFIITTSTGHRFIRKGISK